MQQLRRTADLRAVAAHVRQDDPRQYSLAAYRQIVDVSAILAVCRLGVDPGCQFGKCDRAIDTAVGTPYFHARECVSSFIELDHDQTLLYFWAILNACPSGSRTDKPWLNPACPSTRATTPGEINENLPARKRPSASRTSAEMKFVS